MDKERRALLEEAARCRRTAAETDHEEAAQKLIAMAEQYEARAAKLMTKSAKRTRSGATPASGLMNGDPLLDRSSSGSD